MSEETPLPFVKGRVTLLVPCYDNARFLPFLLESLIAQTHTDWEMLICNDCSPDDTELVAEKLADNYSDRRIRYFETEQNGGPAVARNICIRNSTGEYMVQMDPDDMLPPASLQIRVDAIKEMGEESWACGWLYVVRGDCTYKEAMTLQEQQKLHVDQHDPKYRCVSGLPKAGSPSVMAHRNLFVRYGLYDEHPELYSKTDRELWARWIGFGAIPSHIKRPVTFYRKHSGSIQTNYSKRQIDSANIIRMNNVLSRLVNGVSEENTTLWHPVDAEIVRATNTRERGVPSQIKLIQDVDMRKVLRHVPSHIKGSVKVPAAKSKAEKLSEEIVKPVPITDGRIRVLFPEFASGNRGKQKFFAALARELPKLGITVVTDRTAWYDVSLVGNLDKYGRPTIARLDGLYYTGNYPDRDARNRRIFQLVCASSAVVFQSEFSKKIYLGVAEEMAVDLGLEKKIVTVIYNGAPVQVPRVKTKLIGSPTVIAACREWLPEKRLPMLLRAFKVLRRQMPKAKLYLAGKVPNGLKVSPAVKVLGDIKEPQKLLELMASADVYAHTVYQDSCPNAVVEALSVGTPVVCSQEGGQAELVVHEVNGVVAQCDSGPSYHYVSWNEPEFDTQKYADALVTAAKRLPWRVRPVVSDIKQTAEKYAEVIKEVMEKHK